MRKGYPLAAVRQQREQRQEQAALHLSEARAARALAQQHVQQAQAQLAAHTSLRSAALAPERARCHAADVARKGAYGARLQVQLGQLQQQLTAAQRTLAEQARAVRLAELTLLDAHAQHELIERHYAQFREQQRKAAEHIQELENEERQPRPAQRIGSG